MAHEWQGHLDKAIPAFQSACELGGNLPAPLGALGHALAISGEKEKKEARRILQRLLEISDQPAVDIARQHEHGNC